MWKKHKLVMLPTEEKAGLKLGQNGLLVNNTLGYDSHFINQHLYILSDEEIKEGDWFYYKHFGEDIISRTNENTDLVNLNHPDKYFKKIIATTDKSLSIVKEKAGDNVWTQQLPQIPQSFIEKFVEEYNKGNTITEVMVEYDNHLPDTDGDFGKIQLKKDNTINIKSIKDSQSKEKIKDILENYRKFAWIHGVSKIALEQWIEENLNN